MQTVELTAALIVDGLALSVTSVDLREMFLPFGPVVWCRVAVDRFGRSLRYGYVVMKDAGDAGRAIEALNGKTLAGHPIIVAHTAVPPLPRRV